jgi:small subunit ribosomal protein S21
VDGNVSGRVLLSGREEKLFSRNPLSGSGHPNGRTKNNLPSNPVFGYNDPMVEIRLKRGESVDKALRRLKKKLDREGILRDVRARRSHEKPSVKRRRKMKEPKINFYGNFSL